MSREVVFWGGTGHAKVLRELLNHSEWDLVAVFDNNVSVSSPFINVPIYYGVEGFRKWKGSRRVEEISFLVAIGGEHGRDRFQIQEFLKREQLKVATAIHDTAFVASSVDLGEGAQILAHATVCAEVKVGPSCILNTASSVDHECFLGTGVHIGPGAVLAGLVKVGDYSFIGAGSVILPRIVVGSDVVVGAGSVVTKNVEDGAVVYGNPARVIRRCMAGCRSN